MCHRAAADRCDHTDLSADKVGGQRRQSTKATVPPAVFARHVLSLDIAGFVEAAAEPSDVGCGVSRRAAVEVADHLHRLLRRVWGERPGRSRAGEKGSKVPPPYRFKSVLARRLK